MSAIKKFFEKRKADAKFKAAGPGHKLTETHSSSKSSSSMPPKPLERAQPSQSSQMAGVAAIQRIQQQQSNKPSMANRSLNVIRAEARKELELENKMKTRDTPPREVIDSPPILAVNGVFFTCPLVGPDVLPKAEMEAKIKEFLYQQLEDERGLTACLIIQTCNKDREKVRVCVETLCKCLDKIVENPQEEKYQKIRVNTKTFQEKLKPIEGAIDFLLAAGFERQLFPHGTEEQEEFYVLPAEKLENLDNLIVLRDALISAEPIRPELDRNVRVLSSCHPLQQVEIPSEFYNLTVDDIKREKILKSEEVEKNLMLRTKAMREIEAMRELRKYRFCLIRVRFPDGLILQGTFKTWEKLSALKEFVCENLHNKLPFILAVPGGQQLVEDESTLAEIGLVPAAIINFAWNSSYADDDELSNSPYLKPDTLLLCSDV